MPLFEIGSFPPIRAGDNIHFAIMIEVAKGRSLRPELLSELNFFEGVQAVVGRRRKQNGGEETHQGAGDCFHETMCGIFSLLGQEAFWFGQ